MSRASLAKLTPPPQWYSGRPTYTHTLTTLQSLLSAHRSTLFHRGIIPKINSPVNAIDIKLPASIVRETTGRVWLSKQAVEERLGTRLKSSHYKKIITVLADLQGLAPYLVLKDKLDNAALSREHIQVLDRWTDEKRTTIAKQASADKKYKGGVDKLGRAYSSGKRKDSSARAWIIPTLPENADTPTILVNNKPLPDYFPLASHRSAILRPLEITNQLSKFNVFVLARGGGKSGQAGATAVAIARAIAVMEREGKIKPIPLVTRPMPVLTTTFNDILPKTEEKHEFDGAQVSPTMVLKRAMLLRRDPRVVERKKTGRPKARKRNTWVKR